MKLNDKQKSWLVIFLVFLFGTICKELGEFIIKGQTIIETYSYFIVIGAAFPCILGIIFTRNQL